MLTLDKYLLREMTVPFMLGFLLILLLVFGNIVYANLNLIVSRLSQLDLVVSYLLCKLPDCVLISLPAGAIFGVCLGVGRLARESELIAIRDAGIPNSRLFVSIVFWGILLTLVGYVFQEYVVVKSEGAAEGILNKIYSVPGNLPIEPDIFIKSGDYCIRVHRIERTKTNTVYHSVMLYSLNHSTGFPALVTAKRAYDKSGIWILKNGCAFSFTKDGLPDTAASFEEMRIAIDSSVFAGLTSVPKENSSYSCMQLKKKIADSRRAGIKPGDMELEYAFKQAFPLSSLAIILCLVPLCLRLPQKNSAYSLVIGIAVFFVYWNIMWFARVLGETGGINPYCAGWSIVICFGAAAAVLLFGLDR